MVLLQSGHNVSFNGRQLQKTEGVGWNACAIFQTRGGDFELSVGLASGENRFHIGLIGSDHNPVTQPCPQSTTGWFVYSGDGQFFPPQQGTISAFHCASYTVAVIKYETLPTPTVSVSLDGGEWKTLPAVIPAGDYRPCILMHDTSTVLNVGSRRDTDPGQHCHPILKDMWLQGLFCDAAILSNGESFQCHRGVLAAASPVWRSALQGGFREGQDRTLHINDFAPSTIEMALKYIYTDDLDADANFSALLRFAHQYELPRLLARCGDEVIKNLTADTVVEASVLSDFREDKRVATLWSDLVDAVQKDRTLVESLLAAARPRHFQPSLRAEAPLAQDEGDANDSASDLSFEIVHPADTCFLKNALLPVAHMDYKMAHSLKVGEKVLSSTGKELEVAWCRVHLPAPRKLVTLRTAQAELTVTLEHRVVVPGHGGSNGERLAKDLAVGDHVFCGSRPQAITKIVQYEQTTEVVEVRFKPDEAVEARMAPRWGILTKGERLPGQIQSFGIFGPWNVVSDPSGSAGGLTKQRARSAER